MKLLKTKNKKGFTLMEMLIVIAIIAILVAIAIPTFSGAQKRARYAADQANVRAWYAESLIANMTDGTALPVTTDYTDTLQLTGAAVTVVGTTADTFTVTYTPATADVSAGYIAVSFPQ